MAIHPGSQIAIKPSELGKASNTNVPYTVVPGGTGTSNLSGIDSSKTSNLASISGYAGETPKAVGQPIYTPTTTTPGTNTTTTISSTTGLSSSQEANLSTQGIYQATAIYQAQQAYARAGLQMPSLRAQREHAGIYEPTQNIQERIEGLKNAPIISENVFGYKGKQINLYTVKDASGNVRVATPEEISYFQTQTGQKPNQYADSFSQFYGKGYSYYQSDILAKTGTSVNVSTTEASKIIANYEKQHIPSTLYAYAFENAGLTQEQQRQQLSSEQTFQKTPALEYFKRGDYATALRKEVIELGQSVFAGIGKGVSATTGLPALTKSQVQEGGTRLGEVALFLAFSPTMLTSPQIQSLTAIPEKNVIFQGYTQSKSGNLIATDVGFVTSRGEIGTATSLSKIIPVNLEEGSLAVGKTFASGSFIPKGLRGFFQGETKFVGADISFARTLNEQTIQASKGFSQKFDLIFEPARITARLSSPQQFRAISVGGKVFNENLIGIIGKLESEKSVGRFLGILKKTEVLPQEFSSIISPLKKVKPNSIGVLSQTENIISKQALQSTADIVTNAVQQVEKNVRVFPMVSKATTATLLPAKKVSLNQSQSLISIVKQSDSVINRETQIQTNIQEPRQKQQQNIILKDIITEVQGQSPRQIPRTKQTLISEEIFVRPIQPIPPRLPEDFFGLPKISGSSKNKQRGRIKTEKTYNVFLKRRGKFNPIATDLILNQALNLGSRRTRRSLQKTFRIAPTGKTKDIFESDIPYSDINFFREYRIQRKKKIATPLTFIKKQRAVWSTPEEKYLLSQARKSKRRRRG